MLKQILTTEQKSLIPCNGYSVPTATQSKHSSASRQFKYLAMLSSYSTLQPPLGPIFSVLSLLLTWHSRCSFYHPVHLPVVVLLGLYDYAFDPRKCGSLLTVEFLNWLSITRACSTSVSPVSTFQPPYLNSLLECSSKLSSLPWRLYFLNLKYLLPSLHCALPRLLIPGKSLTPQIYSSRWWCLSGHCHSPQMGPKTWKKQCPLSSILLNIIQHSRCVSIRMQGPVRSLYAVLLLKQRDVIYECVCGFRF